MLRYKQRIYILMAFLILGALLLGSGTTGYVIGSCCSGDDCPVEEQCVNQEAAATSYDPTLIAIGIMLLGIGAAVFYGEHLRKYQ